MCTLLLRHLPGDQYPLAILSNRDEAYERPSEGWAWRGPDRRYFAPLDQQAGGTWMGLSEAGLVVALTNIFPPRKGAGFRSRGALVTAMLALPEAASAPAHLRRQLAAHSYNNFNLLTADARRAFLFTWVETDLLELELLPGVYQVGNEPYEGTARPDASGNNEKWIIQQAPLLREHPHICKHGDDYGTRASHKLLVHGTDPVQSRIWHLEGHPCQGQFQLVMGAANFESPALARRSALNRPGPRGVARSFDPAQDGPSISR